VRKPQKSDDGKTAFSYSWEEINAVTDPEATEAKTPRNKRKRVPKAWYDAAHRGLTGAAYYPWIELEVGDWFFVPYHPTKSSRQLGYKTPLKQRICSDLQNTNAKVTWVPGLTDRRFKIEVREHICGTETPKNLLGVMVTRTH
jgi:hypothetical protein